MGHERNVKLIRGQVRQVTQNILGDILALEKKEALYKELTSEVSSRVTQLTTEVRERMEAIEKNVMETLKGLNQRSLDIQEFMLRNLVVNNVPPPVPTEVASVLTDEQKAEADKFMEENKELMDDLQAQEQEEKSTNSDSQD